MAAAPRPKRPRRLRPGWILAVAIAAVLAGAVAGARVGWLPALLAEVSAQAAWITLAVALLALARRRWRSAAVLAACCGLHLPFIFHPRAAAVSGAPQLRLLVHNAHSGSVGIGAMIERLRGSDADVIVLVEPDAELVRTLSRDRPLAASHPHLLMRGPRPGSTSWRVVLSRWALEDRRTEDELICVVDGPFGRFGLIALHPASPRNPQRWRSGTELVRSAAASAETLVQESLPVIIAGDLNSTPTGWRDRLLRDEAPVRRCKPVVRFGGTFPARLAAPLRLALDDAWVTREWGVCEWRVGAAADSDHVSVEIGLRLLE